MPGSTKVMQFHPPTRRNQAAALKIETQGAVVWVEFREDSDGRPVTVVDINPDGTRYGQDWRVENASGDPIAGRMRVVDHKPKAEA